MALVAAATACSPSPPPAKVGARNDQALLLGAARGMQRCWLSGDAAFAGYRMADERNSAAKRVLLVDRSNPRGLPQLVAQASGSRVSVFGPLATPARSAKIRSWSQGSTAC